MAENSKTSRKIPEPTKRIVRQRCGFGCVVCGLPLYEYHHMVDWALVKEHVAEEITLLCDSHHREATNGLITPNQVRGASENPINISRGVSAPFGLHFELDEYRTFHAVIGGNRFSTSRQTQTVILSIDDMDLIWVQIDKDGQLSLHLNIFDEFNNRVLVVVGNELAFASKTWDITFEGKTLTLREAKRELLLEITFLPPCTICIDRGCLLFNGVELIITPKLIYCGGRVMAGSLSHDCQAGLVVGRNDRGFGAGYGWPNVQRYSPDQRKQHKHNAIKEQANLSDIISPHVATGMDRYVSTVTGSEDFHIKDEAHETNANDD